jgi:hypothetical protein
LRPKVEGCAIVESISGPAAWEAEDLRRVDRTLQQLALPFGWSIIACYDGGAVWLQVRCAEGTDNVTGAPVEWRGRKWLLSRHMTAGEIAQTVLKAVLTAAEHEIRELVELRARPDALKERS